METRAITNNVHGEIKKVLYTGNVHIIGGREGSAQSADGRLDIKLSTPGTPGTGTNPEQLFAAGWSACFIGAIKVNAPRLGITVPADTAIDAEVDLANDETGFCLQARLHVSLPGLSYDEAETIVKAAHETCPYSKATRGNINVQISLAV
ncbi:organic hydroperoxide resistance protein [Pinibacter soli]|uniref:Organic hydroperoxide resistance protein n=1 Tax=Pinibacter soli TaxID=3044211 RepID=A0ABT6RAG7_9BACT|nr:organic hydroperoxide resistance protein [Pinibacter soli]MDI3319456.1 organic hydroperoxide resistance protein [Pinibacter soli]